MTDAAEFFASVREHVFGGRLTADQVDGMNAILSAWATHGDGDNRKLAYLLGTAKHETADTMQPIHELGKKSYFDKYEPTTKIGKALGNTQPGDGFLFRGRGFVQLTGRRNYEHAGKQLGFNLVAVPEQALNAAVAADILVKGCLEGWFTGRKLGGFINAGETDFINARRVVNGTDRAVLIAGYANKFEDALRGKLPIPANRPPVQPVSPSPAPSGHPEVHEEPLAPAPRRKTLADILGNLFHHNQRTIAMATNSAVVPVKSAWASKLNWTMALGVIFNVLMLFGHPVPADVQVAVTTLGNSAFLVLGYVIKTFFTTSISAPSAKSL